MIILEVKNFIQTHQRVSQYQIAQHFDIQVQSANDILHLLVQKGVIMKEPCENGCATSCTGCKPILDEVYLWNNHLGSRDIQRV